MLKRALVVQGAVANIGLVDEVLQRFGFVTPIEAPSFDAAVARVRDEHFDLLIVSLVQLSAVELAALEREIRQRERTFVIGTAPKPDSELILQAMRSGVHEFVLSTADSTDFATAVDRLMRRGEQETAQGTVVAVYSAKGGLGTSTVALNLAFAVAKHHPRGRVALADMVVSGGDLRVLLNLKSSYDIGDLLARMQRIDAELLTSILTPVEGGVWVLPAAERPEVAELVDAAAAATIIGQLREHFGFTILDCEHHLTERTLSALDFADRVLLVTQLNVAALRSTQRTLDLAQRLGYPDDKIRVLVNRHQGTDVLTLSDASELLGRPVYYHLPNDYKAATASLAKGVSVLAHDSSSKLAESYMALAGKLTGPGLAARNGKHGASTTRLGRLLGFGRK